MKSNGSSGARDGAAIAAALGAWFDVARRDLPWRRTCDPYAIWVSEIMLQQTRVATVRGYFPRFLRAFPTVHALASAPLSRVLAAWSGLGYYRRARALSEGARYVVARHAGVIPEDPAALREIPGIGHTTAGAIASIAYDVREPVLDGNVARVLSRLFAMTKDVRSPEGARALWALASDLLPARRPGRHNEALMELGAVVCLPKGPHCGACPVARLCRARARDLVAGLPVTKKRAPVKSVPLVAVVVRRKGSVLLGRRDGSGLLPGLWEPPMVEAVPGRRAARLVADLLGAPRVALRYVGEHTHVLTHRRLLVRVATARVDPGRLRPRPPYDRLAWRRIDSLSRSAVSTLCRKVLGTCPARPSRV